MKESGTLIRIDLDFKNVFNSSGHSCLWAILRGLGVPDVDFLEDLYSKSWMKIQVAYGMFGPHTRCEIEKFIIRQPPIGEKDDYDSENSWISDGLPNSIRRRRRGGGRWKVGEWREK